MNGDWDGGELKTRRKALLKDFELQFVPTQKDGGAGGGGRRFFGTLSGGHVATKVYISSLHRSPV
jgi:hypothetical protein